MSGLDSPRPDRADRRVGWLIAVSALPLAVWWVPDALDQWHRFPLWWNLAAWAVIASLLTMSVFGMRLPMRALRALWTVTPLAPIALQLVSFGVLRGDTAELMPWIWLPETAAICLLVLQARPAVAIAASFASSLGVALSAWLFTGAIPQVVLTNLPLRLSNIALIVIAVGAHRRLAALHEAETGARIAAERRARSAADARRRARFSRFVHDEVLSVLTAANLFRGEPPPELRAGAAATIRALESGSPSASNSAQSLDPLEAAERLRARLTRISPAAEISVETDGPPVAADAVEALGDAAAEALRNASRHAGAKRIEVRVAVLRGGIEVSVADDGVGFDAAAAPEERMGIRQSVVARVCEIGGDAQIISAPGAGTEVRLSWTA